MRLHLAIRRCDRDVREIALLGALQPGTPSAAFGYIERIAAAPRAFLAAFRRIHAQIAGNLFITVSWLPLAATVDPHVAASRPAAPNRALLPALFVAPPVTDFFALLGARDFTVFKAEGAHIQARALVEFSLCCSGHRQKMGQENEEK